MTRTATNAITWGRAQITNPTRDWYRWCLVYVRSCFDVPARWPDAGTAWDQAQRKHPTSRAADIPAGVPVFWELASVADHVALSTGGGMCLSNDIRRRGRIDEVPIDEITRSWSGQLLGWTEDLNGHTIFHPTTEEDPDMTPAQDKLLRETAATVKRLETQLTKEKTRDAKEKARDKKRHQKIMTALRGTTADLDAIEKILTEDDA